MQRRRRATAITNPHNARGSEESLSNFTDAEATLEMPFPTRHPRKGEEVVFVLLRWWNKLVLYPVLPTPGVTSGHCVCNSSVTLGRFQHEEHETYPAVLEEGPGGDPVVFLPGGGVS